MPSGFGNPFGFQSGPRLVEGGPSFYMPPSFGMQFPSAMGPMGFGGMGGMGGFQPGMMPLMSQFGQFARPMPRPQPQPSFDPQMLQGIFQNLFEQFNRAPEGEPLPQPAEQPDYLSQIQDLQRQLEELRSGQQEQDLGTPEITTGTDELMDRMFPDGPPPFQPDVGGGGQVSTMPIAPPGGFPRFGEEVGEGLTIGETIDMEGGPARPPILKGGPVDPGVIDQMVIVYGPDGTMYPSPGAARAAGVTDYTMTPPGGGFRLPGFGDISGPPSKLLPPGAGGIAPIVSCFVAGTKVDMADGSQKDIENIKVGDKVKALDNQEDEVAYVHDIPEAQRQLWTINDRITATDSHAFLTEDGWKSNNPELSNIGYKDYNIEIGKLMVGDKLITDDGVEEIKKLDNTEDFLKVYNFTTSSTHTYLVDGVVSHNKMPDDRIPPPRELLPPGAGGTGNIPEIGIGRGPGGPGEIVPPMVPPEGGGFRGLPPGLGRDLRIPRPMPGSLIGGPSRDRFGMPIDQGPIRIPPQRGPEDPIMRTMPVMPPGGFPRFGVEPIMRPMPMPRPGILPEIPRPDVGGGGRVSTMPVRLPMPRFPR
jgi:hypothetical protein